MPYDPSGDVYKPPVPKSNTSSMGVNANPYTPGSATYSALPNYGMNTNPPNGNGDTQAHMSPLGGWVSPTPVDHNWGVNPNPPSAAILPNTQTGPVYSANSGGGGGGGGGYTPPAPQPINRDVSAYKGHNLLIANNNIAHNQDAGTGITQAMLASQNTPAPAAAAPAPTTQTISIPDPAADPTYKYQHAALEKALMNYQGGQTLGATQYNSNYNEGLNKLGWDGKEWSQGNQGAYAQARGDNTSDYASRGLGRSSSFADSLGMIDKQFNDQKAGLDRSKNDYSDTQRSALGAYTDQNQATDHGALLDAISRIATQKGVDLSQVVPGKVGSTTRPI